MSVDSFLSILIQVLTVTLMSNHYHEESYNIPKAQVTHNLYVNYTYYSGVMLHCLTSLYSLVVNNI